MKDVAHMVRVLLVEDSKFLRVATERALSRAGFQVSSAADGEQALQLATQKPDVILLDLLLPKMTGPDVLKALKSNPSTAAIPVVVLSAMSSKNADRLRRDGAFEFLVKEDLALVRGAGPLLRALDNIVRKLHLESAAAK